MNLLYASIISLATLTYYTPIQPQPLLEKVEARADALSYSEVVEVPNASKDELFIRGREWFNESFKSSKHVLQIEDKETGELAGKGNMTVYYTYKYMGDRTYPGEVDFTINIWVKDGRYKYEIGNFNSSGSKSLYQGPLTESDETSYKYPMISEKKMNEIYKSVKDEVNKEVQLIIESLKQKMSQESKASSW